jgi:hypothetical protein
MPGAGPRVAQREQKQDTISDQVLLKVKRLKFQVFSFRLLGANICKTLKTGSRLEAYRAAHTKMKFGRGVVSCRFSLESLVVCHKEHLRFLAELKRTKSFLPTHKRY